MQKKFYAGSMLFGIAIAGFALIQLVTQNFLSALLPVATTFPARTICVNIISVLILLSAIGILLNYNRKMAALLTAFIFLLFFFALDLPILFSDYHNPNGWTISAESLSISCGAFFIANLNDHEKNADRSTNKLIYLSAFIARYLFVICLVVFGVQHFLYESFIVTLIPKWIPAPVFLTYIIRFAFLIAALSLLTGFFVRPVFILLGVMFVLWVIVLHIPLVINHNGQETQWTSLCVAIAMAGISFTLATNLPLFHNHRRKAI